MADVVPVDSNLPGIDVIKATEQVDDGRLARARRPDQGNRFARRCVHADVLQHRFARLVAECDIIECDVTVNLRQWLSVRQISDCLTLIEHVEDALCSGQR